MNRSQFGHAKADSQESVGGRGREAELYVTEVGDGRTVEDYAVVVNDLHCAYGKTEAVRGLSFGVKRGRCYGLFGRNGAGKSTTIKCLLNLLRPSSGKISVLGVSPQKDELAVKGMIGYVPEQVAFHPWMTVERVLRYYAAFRPAWDVDLQERLLRRFDLDPKKRVDAMSKGMRSQLALVCSVCPNPEILLLDEPTSGLDPVIRREFLQTVIGAFLESDPGRKTVLVSTHLIGEWEGLIDEFTIVDKGRELITMETEEARARCRRIYLRWGGEGEMVIPEELGRVESGAGVMSGEVARQGSLVRLVSTSFTEETEVRLRGLGAEVVEVEPLSLEDIFVATSGRRSGDNGDASGGVA